MTENMRIQGVPDREVVEHGGLTGSGRPIEEKRHNSAEVSTERPRQGYAAPALSVDQQTATDGD